MNYANMIEEKNLKKGFIIATLISTVISTFGTSLGLYERIADRHKQHKTDHGQNEKLQELERRLDASERARRRERERDDYDHEHRHGRWHGGDDDDSVRDELAASGPLIRREYDRNYARFGPRAAEGDAIVRSELQAQIIEMQASVIRLLQDALATGTTPDPGALYAAAGRARNGSIRALNDQYQRLLAAAPIDNYEYLVDQRALRSASLAPSSSRRSYYAEPGGGSSYGRRRGTDSDNSDNSDNDDRYRRQQDRRRRSVSHAAAGTRRALTFPALPPPPAGSDVSPRAISAVAAPQTPLFCRYAIQLQKDWRRPLALGSSSSSDDGSDNDDRRSNDDRSDPICPACMGSFAIEYDRSWKMHKPVVVGEEEEDPRDGGKIVERVRDRLFVVRNRFIVKCHRPAVYDSRAHALLPPTYVCCLCDQFDAEGKVAVCSSMARLVNHVCEKHSVGELLSDPDIREVRRHSPDR